MNFEKTFQRLRDKFFTSKTDNISDTSHYLKCDLLTDDGRKAITLKIEALFKSIEFINTSCDLNKVLYHLNIVCNLINELLLYTDTELESASDTCHTPLSHNSLSFILNNRINIINRAIERYVRHELNFSASPEKRLEMLVEQIKNRKNLVKENIAFLDKLYLNIRDEFFLTSKNSNNNDNTYIIDDLPQKHTSDQLDASPFTIKVQYGRSVVPKAQIYTKENVRNYDLEIEYVQLSTSGDENVCPMCAQFEGIFFLGSNAPKLPLCPNCALRI